MAKLITKFKYLKPNARKSVGGYAKYIATREGVEKIDVSYKLSPPTEKQRKFIAKILKDFPDSKEMLEYEDYLKEQTLGNASDYIATRPRAERFGTHGLFTDNGVKVKLKEVSDELNKHKGNVWTVIISLRREDAERLGYNNGERWRDMLCTKTNTLAKNFKIPMEDLHWYAAFHNESHHPHVHLMVYGDDSQKPYLSRQAIMDLRSSLAKDIFKDDLHEIYQKQTVHRDDLRFCAAVNLLQQSWNRSMAAYMIIRKLKICFERLPTGYIIQAVRIFEIGCKGYSQPHCNRAVG